ncbi:MAG: HepT-like ribonuclease domain-containing protein [Armatimonadota bacterium]
MPRDADALLDILNAATLIQTFLSGISKDAFEQDVMRQAAVVREFEIIGEAAKRVSDDFKAAHPAIAWRGMAGMRDILIHAYDHVDLDEVWNAAEQSIPELIDDLTPLVHTDGE